MENKKLDPREEFYQEMLRKHLKGLEFKERIEYQIKVLNKAGIISPGLKQAIYQRAKNNCAAIEENYSDDIREIRHNYGVCENSSEASAQANQRYRRDMRILQPLEEKIEKMKLAEYKEGGAGI